MILVGFEFYSGSMKDRSTGNDVKYEGYHMYFEGETKNPVAKGKACEVVNISKRYIPDPSYFDSYLGEKTKVYFNKYGKAEALGYED